MQRMKLEKGRTILFRKRISVLSCVEGSVWINWKWGEDICLSGGETMQTAKLSLVQLHALDDSVIEVERISIRDLLQNQLFAIKSLFLKWERPRVGTPRTGSNL